MFFISHIISSSKAASTAVLAQPQRVYVDIFNINIIF